MQGHKYIRVLLSVGKHCQYNNVSAKFPAIALPVRCKGNRECFTVCQMQIHCDSITFEGRILHRQYRVPLMQGWHGMITI